MKLRDYLPKGTCHQNYKPRESVTFSQMLSLPTRGGIQNSIAFLQVLNQPACYIHWLVSCSLATFVPISWLFQSNPQPKNEILLADHSKMMANVLLYMYVLCKQSFHDLFFHQHLVKSLDNNSEVAKFIQIKLYAHEQVK